MMGNVVSTLIKTIRSAVVFNPDVQMAPAYILWPDRDRQWEAVIPGLQNEMPELLVLGVPLSTFCPRCSKPHKARRLPSSPPECPLGQILSCLPWLPELTAPDYRDMTL